jgi:hypothetical protein
MVTAAPAMFAEANDITTRAMEILMRFVVIEVSSNRCRPDGVTVREPMGTVVMAHRITGHPRQFAYPRQFASDVRFSVITHNRLRGLPPFDSDQNYGTTLHVGPPCGKSGRWGDAEDA